MEEEEEEAAAMAVVAAAMAVVAAAMAVVAAAAAVGVVEEQEVEAGEQPPLSLSSLLVIFPPSLWDERDTLRNTPCVTFPCVIP